MSSIRLAIIGSRGIPARYGGFETFAEELSTRLVERGIEVTVFCEDSQSPSLLIYKGVHLKHLPRLRLGPLSTLVLDSYGILLAARKYDVIYVLGYGAPFLFWLPRVFGSELWVNMDGIEWARSKWSKIGQCYLRIAEYLAIALADRVIADAEAIATFLRSRHQRIKSVSVIPYGAAIAEDAHETKFLESLAIRRDDYFLVVSRLEPENHVLEIVEGFVRSNSARTLLIVGELSKDRAYVKELLSIADPRVRMIGSVYDGPALRELRSHARAYFHGHSVGGTNPSLLEALACGNIAIAHDNPFNREVCGTHALYFRSSDDIPELVRQVDRLDHEALSELALRARSVISSRYSWELVTDRYYTLLEVQLP